MKKTRVPGLAAIAVAGLITAGLSVAPAPPASASDNCGQSEWVQSITLNPAGDTIILTPTEAARDRSDQVAQDGAYLLNAAQRDVIVSQWHSIQQCVGGLFGDKADSVWQQLECHQKLAFAHNPVDGSWLTGPTFDLELFHPPLPRNWFNSEASTVAEVLSKCGNSLHDGTPLPVSPTLMPDSWNIFR